MSVHPNIVDPDKIKAYLSAAPFADLPDNVKSLFIPLCLRLIKRQTAGTDGYFRDFVRLRKLPAKAASWLKKSWDEAIPFHRFDPSDELFRELKTIGFWLEQAVQRQAPWTNDAAAFSKRASFSSIHGAALSAAHNLKVWGCETELFERLGHLKAVHLYDDGSKMVEILTEAEMKREKEKTGTCVGDPQQPHIDHLKDKNARFFSLRDAHNDSHATLKLWVRGGNYPVGQLVEIKGKQNLPAVKKYDPYILSFLAAFPDIKTVARGARDTGIHTQNGQYYSYRQLPDGYSANELDLSLTDDVVLPRRMTVKKLYLKGENPPTIPADAQIDEIVLQWKQKSGYVWLFCTNNAQPSEIIYTGSGRVISANVHKLVTTGTQIAATIKDPIVLSQYADYLRLEKPSAPVERLLQSPPALPPPCPGL